MSLPHTTEADDAERRLGLVFALTAFGLWGILPAYYKWTSGVGADVVVAHRIVWSVVFLGLFLTLRGRMGEVRDALCDRKRLPMLALSAAIISMNWLIFIWAVADNRILEVSFGYFANPLVSVALGLIVLKEKISRWQAVAIAIAALAVAIQALALDAFPWVSVGLAFTFASYGFLRKMVVVGASPGLMVESVLLAPLALAYLFYSGGWEGNYVLPLDNPGLLLLLMGTGIVTAFPLALFAAGARRLPLSMIGLMQYVAPSLQLILAIFVYGEEIQPLLLATFGLIWISLAIFTTDTIYRRERRG
ncbi:MAG: protein RarD [Rhodobacteraceae bacterium]|uniref:EamA family transporter RarD n=1 Tax=Stappia stellulata TaxID=71235 RepID=UPI000C39CF74|nr:EamA family transporter RarD [Stappia stellulata]MBB98791.1 protein RarD [Paracoccaceae bacterium]MCA1241613.1 EamA family transporter RarD [Stappia stellulata]